MSKQNTPFIVRVRRTEQPCCITGKPLVSVEGTIVGTWAAEWMYAENFPMKENQQKAYFICTKKGHNLRVHKEVYLKRERLLEINKPFILEVRRVFNRHTRQWYPLAIASTDGTTVIPTLITRSQAHCATILPAGKEKTYYIATFQGDDIVLHCEVSKKA